MTRGKHYAIGHRGRALLLISVCAFTATGASCPKQGNPPTITSLEAASGPSGSIVRVHGQNFGTGGLVYFDNTPVRTQGSGDPLLFTVPYAATVGNHSVSVEVQNFRSATTTFQVTTVAAAPSPTLDGAEVGLFSVGTAVDGRVMELVAFGTGMDSNTNLIVDGAELPGATPGVPAGSLIGAFGASAVLPGFPPQHYDKAVFVILSQNGGNLPAPGSTHNIQAKNTVTGAVSNTISVTVPSRRVLVELDRVDSVNWPPSGIFQNNRINTLRRPYTAAGLLIDRRFDQSVADPHPVAGTAFTDADVLDFFTNNRSLNTQTLGGEWYFHVGLLTMHTDATLLGRMFRTTDRDGMAVFVNSAPSDANYLRTLVHEMGHGYNLTHCEGNAVINRDASGSPITCSYGTLGTSIMDQTCALAGGWEFTFTAAAQTHLTSHSLNEVQPGTGHLAFNSASRAEGSCDH